MQERKDVGKKIGWRELGFKEVCMEGGREGA